MAFLATSKPLCLEPENQPMRPITVQKLVWEAKVRFWADSRQCGSNDSSGSDSELPVMRPESGPDLVAAVARSPVFVVCRNVLIAFDVSPTIAGQVRAAVAGDTKAAIFCKERAWPEIESPF